MGYLNHNVRPKIMNLKDLTFKLYKFEDFLCLFL